MLPAGNTRVMASNIEYRPLFSISYILWSFFAESIPLWVVIRHASWAKITMVEWRKTRYNIINYATFAMDISKPMPNEALAISFWEIVNWRLIALNVGIDWKEQIMITSMNTNHFPVAFIENKNLHNTNIACEQIPNSYLFSISMPRNSGPSALCTSF